ncbi:MAG: hypothetical protein EZS28_054537, partial [Streblomastix strix]
KKSFTSAYVAPAALNPVIIAWRIVGPVYGDVITALLMIAVNWWLQYSELAGEYFYYNWTTDATTFFKCNCVNDFLLCFGILPYVLRKWQRSQPLQSVEYLLESLDLAY